MIDALSWNTKIPSRAATTGSIVAVTEARLAGSPANWTLCGNRVRALQHFRDVRDSEGIQFPDDFFLAHQRNRTQHQRNPHNLYDRRAFMEHKNPKHVFSGTVP